MNDEIKYIEDEPIQSEETEKKETIIITPPTWSIEPPLEIERKDDEL
jgi:hypothetical protein